MEYQIRDDIDRLMAVLPPEIVHALKQLGHQDELVEVVMDLGRQPAARYVDGTQILREKEITHDDLEYVVLQLSNFDADNRSGIERTLHRISAIRNRVGDIVGLTCRVGRAVFGTIEIIEDLISSQKCVLILGAPGVGKTTMLREAARVLADQRRVVIVDTSNEIGGDGDIPHPAIGQSRRMQVSQPTLQHEVMIEAVENHNPEVIIIDEIGRELEALAARTIAERGVQLIGTAHGNTLENLLRNPTLSDLVGGVQAVTLSDEEARRRRTQKTVLERRAPPTFDILIEIQDRQQMVIHPDVAAAVDAHLRGYPLPAELRYRDEDGEVYTETVVPRLEQKHGRQFGRRDVDHRPQTNHRKTRRKSNAQAEAVHASDPADESGNGLASNVTIQVYPYGVAHNRLLEAAERLQVSMQIVEDMTNADVLVTIKSYYRNRPRLILDAERRNIPIHVLRANTAAQVESFLVDIFQLDTEEEQDPYETAMADVQRAIRSIQAGKTRSVNLKPQTSYIRRSQHELIRSANLASNSYGREPNRYVRVFQSDLN